MIDLLVEFITDRYITVIKEIFSGDGLDRVSDRYPEGEARRPLIYLRTDLPLIASSSIGDFVEEDLSGEEPVDKYEIRVGGVSTDIVLETRSEAERKSIGDKLVLYLLLGRDDAGRWYKNRLGANGIDLVGVMSGGTIEEDVGSEGRAGKIFRVIYTANSDISLLAEVRPGAVSLITVTGTLVASL